MFHPVEDNIITEPLIVHIKMANLIENFFYMWCQSSKTPKPRGKTPEYFKIYFKIAIFKEATHKKYSTNATSWLHSLVALLKNGFYENSNQRTQPTPAFVGCVRWLLCWIMVFTKIVTNKRNQLANLLKWAVYENCNQRKQPTNIFVEYGF